MRGEEFEERLGEFLRGLSAFPRIKGFLSPSLGFQTTTPAIAESTLGQWHRYTEFHLGEIVKIIRESLYELFGSASTNTQGAADAYRALLSSLGIRIGTPWVYATTNYDTIGEAALADLHLHPDWGHPHEVTHGNGVDLFVEDLLATMPRSVPVLHLHGRIGWYREASSERNYFVEHTRFDPGFGVPIVMLPDPEKAYDGDDVLAILWSQFEEALSRARRVFVLGHSLNDSRLVDALLRHVEPLTRVVVGCFGNGVDFDQSSKDLRELVDSKLEGALTVPLRFGPKPSLPQGRIDEWRQAVSTLDSSTPA